MSRGSRSLVLVGLLVLAGLALLLAARGCDRPAPAPADSATAPGPVDPAARPATADAPPADSTGFRLRALVLRLGPDGLRLENSSVLPGRIKAPPASVAADRLEFVVTAADGREIWAGSLDHPLHRRFEVESAREPGRLEQVPATVTENHFALRLPAESAGATVIFHEIRAGVPGRRLLGKVSLP